MPEIQPGATAVLARSRPDSLTADARCRPVGLG